MFSAGVPVSYPRDNSNNSFLESENCIDMYLYSCDHYLSLMSYITPSLCNAIFLTAVSISGGRLAATM